MRIIAVSTFLLFAASLANPDALRLPPRKVPAEYGPNRSSFDLLRLPEAWAFLWGEGGKASALRSRPDIYVVDDGFFAHGDFEDPGTMLRGKGFPGGGSMGGGEGICRGFHGTQVATLLAAANGNAAQDSAGWNLAGVAGPWLSRDGWIGGVVIHPIRIHNGGGGCPESAALAAALASLAGPEATAGGTRRRPPFIVNLSFQVSAGNRLYADPDTSLHAALSALRHRALIVVAAGNDRLRIRKGKGWLSGFDNVLLTGALDKRGERYWRNGRSGTRTGKGVDVYAPAESLTVRGSADTGYKASGTSLAAPFVSGTLALMQWANPCMEPEGYIALLKESARLKIMPDGDTLKIVDAYESVRRAFLAGRHGCAGEGEDPYHGSPLGNGQPFGSVSPAKDSRD